LYTYKHLGIETQHNVFIAEVTVLKLAAEVMREDRPYTECHICTDSQSATKAIDNPRQQSGQVVIQDFLDCIDDITDQYPGLQFTIIWIPGHVEIDGNE
jgi:hypothetical protein